MINANTQTGRLHLKRNADHNSIELTNLKLGYLTVIGRTEKRAGTLILWLCKCECGNECLVKSNYLKNGTTRSCGCKTKEMISKKLTTHGRSSKKNPDPTYISWKSMIERCEKPYHKSFKHYSKRLIKICEPWHIFSNFLKDMGDRPSGYQLDRIDNDLGYYPENCRWTTPKINSNNRTSSRYIDFDGKRHSVSEWAVLKKIPVSTLWRRLEAGWGIEKALSQQVKKQKNNSSIVSNRFNEQTSVVEYSLDKKDGK